MRVWGSDESELRLGRRLRYLYCCLLLDAVACVVDVVDAYFLAIFALVRVCQPHVLRLLERAIVGGNREAAGKNLARE